MHTFVIPAFGESLFLEQCIQSLNNQTFKSKIIICTSTPSVYLSSLAEKYKLPYYIHDEKGIAGDWNFALSKVTTPLATIAHQDDIYEPSYAEYVINAMNDDKSGNTLIAFTDYYDLINEKKISTSINSIVKKTLLWPFLLNANIKRVFFKKILLAFGDPICCPSVTFNLDKLSNFSFSPQYSCVLDWYAWYQLAEQKGGFCFINKKLTGHRIHPESETTNQLSKGIRGKEESAMFKMIWGDRFGNLLSWVYAGSHIHNNTPTN